MTDYSRVCIVIVLLWWGGIKAVNRKNIWQITHVYVLLLCYCGVGGIKAVSRKNIWQITHVYVLLLCYYGGVGGLLEAVNRRRMHSIPRCGYYLFTL